MLLLLSSVLANSALSSNYQWMDTYQTDNALFHNIPVPKGFERVPVAKNSFASWLRHLPLKAGKPAVYLHTGQKKINQSAHHAVVDIDIGTQDLQQCADAVIRLRAEYLYAIGQQNAIHFNFTSGDEAAYRKWIDGFRPVVKGNSVTWRKNRQHDASYATFQQYLKSVFMYAGSYSLAQELSTVKHIRDMHIGDVFIKGGFPGHAVLVIDMAAHHTSGEKIFLLAQSYMPAQDIHILRNPSDRSLSPWYALEFEGILHTPEWTFQRDQLKRF